MSGVAPSDPARSGLASPRFVLGLVLRVMMIVALQPVIQERWFADFVLYALRTPGIDPWAAYLAADGDAKAFPYGYAMLLAHAPFVAAGAGADLLFGTGERLTLIGFGTGILAADLALYSVLVRLAGPERRSAVDEVYWLSPLTLYVNYVHGQTDVVPTLLLFAGILFLSTRRVVPAGLCLAASVSAKLSMALIVPFVLMHVLIRNRRMIDVRAGFLLAFVPASLLAALPLLMPGGAHMILGNPELLHALDLGVTFGTGRVVLVLPFVYMVLLFLSWSFAPLDRKSLDGFILLVFITILLTTAAPIGWYLWLTAAVIPYVAEATATGRWSVRLAMLGAVALSALRDSGASFAGASDDLLRVSVEALFALLPDGAVRRADALLATGVSALLVLVAFRVFRRMITDNWIFAITRKPVMIGIAGDSGAGKDTLADAIGAIFGPGRVSHLLGDDYHRYPRKGGVWNALTHLDPRANDLAAMAEDAEKLARGQTCHVAHYDHDTGLFTRRRRIPSNDVVVVNGLHALYLERLSRLYELAVFLDTDPDLRAELKTARDGRTRGASTAKVLESIRRRAPDGDRFIKPQSRKADLVFALRRAPAAPAEAPFRPDALQLTIETSLDVDVERFARELSALAGIPSTISESFERRRLLVHEGFAAPEDVAACFARLVPEAAELLAVRPEWRPGLSGVMQLFIVFALASKRRTVSLPRAIS